MAVSSQKFLPSGKSGSLAVMPAAKLSMIRKPLIATSSDSDVKKTVFDIRNKVTSLTFIFRSKKILKKRILDRKRKLVETEKNKKREERLESTRNKGRKKEDEKLLITPPGGSIIDSLTRFAGFTLLGFIVDKYSNLLPKLISFGKTIQPAIEIFGSFAENLVGNAITFIERGYKAYDTVNDFVKKIGGENYERMFGQFSGALNMFLQAALLTGVAGFGGGLLKPKFLGVDRGGGAGALGAGTLDQQLKRAKQYFSKYSFRTVKETAPIGQARITNALSRTILGLPMAKDLSTREVLKQNKRFAVGYQSQKQSYTSTTDKAIARFIQEGATDRTNQELRKAGVGVIDDAPARNVRRNVLREMGFGNFVGPNEPLTPSRRKSAKYAKPKPVSSNKILGQSFGSEIARIKKSYMKLGLSNSDLISIANNVEGESYFERKAAYDLLDRKGLSSRVTNVPTLDIPRPVNRTSQGILRNQQIGSAPSIPKPGEGIIPRSTPIRQRGILGRGIGRVGQRAALKIGGRTAAKFVGRIPVIGPLIDFVVSIALGDDPGEAAAGAVGAALGGFVGGALAGAGTFGLGALLGGAVGGFVGDLIVRSLYQAAKNYVFKPKSYAVGGQVTRGGKARGAVSRDIKKVGISDIKSKKIQTVAPQQTVVGKNAYLGESKEGDKMISNYQKIYGEKGLQALKDSSRDVKKIKFMRNIWGALGGAYIDMLLGQRPDNSLASDIGSIIGVMTNERYGRKLGQELSISLENSANNIFRHLYAAVGVERPAMDDMSGKRTPSPDGTKADVRGIDSKSEVIGYVGSTGESSGPHIHIETGMGYGGAGGAIPASVLKNIIVGGKPLSEWPLTSGVGMREGGMHRGLDYGIPSGTPITLSGGLKFVEYDAGENEGYGNLVIITDGAGKKYLLGHLSGGPPNPEALKKKKTVAPVKKVSSSGLNEQTSYEVAIHEKSVYFYQQETVLA